MNQKTLISVLVALVAILGGTTIYFLTYYPAQKGPIEATPMPVSKTVPAPVVQNSPITPAVQDENVNRKVYKNNEYGFEFSLAKDSGEWKTMVEKEKDEAGISYIHVIFKTKDASRAVNGEENFVTGEKFPGYASIFAITAWKRDVYQKTVENCKKEPNPGCPEISLGSNKNYIFSLTIGQQDVAPKDLESLKNSLLSSSDLVKTLNFKTLDN
ncbi:MAG: hypothetical protein WA064_02700 [Candidatus Moraniibacteriota bacterium]